MIKTANEMARKFLNSERMRNTKAGEIFELHGLEYCVKHFRDICNECEHINRGIPIPGLTVFKPPEIGVPFFPFYPLEDWDIEGRLLAKRWLDMQRLTYCPRAWTVKSSDVKLPNLTLPDHLRNSTGSVQAKTLLGMFRQLLPMCTTQRYFFANQPGIIMQDFETFEQATLLYETQLQGRLDVMLSFNPSETDEIPARLKQKAKASLVSRFGFLLELTTQGTFWRTMELTTEAYISLLESYGKEGDDHVVLTEKVKAELLQWIGHMFWSLKQAQYVLEDLRRRQHEVYLHETKFPYGPYLPAAKFPYLDESKFPWYPYDLNVLKDNLDVHVIIPRLCRGPLHDFQFMASAFNDLRRASEKHPGQMVHVNYAMMVTIDEMSARFRVLELLIDVGQVIATTTEVKKALFCFKFDPRAAELSSTLCEATMEITNVRLDDTLYTLPTPKNCSFLQELLVLETSCRTKHKEKFLRLPVQASREFTQDLFDVFKRTYSKLYRESIHYLWKRREQSLLSSKAQTENRLAIQKKNKKKGSGIGPSDWETGDMAEARRVPDGTFVDPSLFWAIGDGSVERYKPPSVREKIKTRKLSVEPEGSDSTSMSSGASPSPVVEDELCPTPRSLDQLRESDLITRDILWRKVKGLVRWSSVVQFLARLGCSIISLDGSKKKVVDAHTGRCTVLHRPHPNEECRRDQLDGYRMHLEDWLLIKYEDVITPEERSLSSLSTDTSLDSISIDVEKCRLE
ncbi:hypothetical protein M758_10G019400 [Ceratodon purpureus]|nr:hypothetical protein M758_10G019400 [Ceratodon purpureus]